MEQEKGTGILEKLLGKEGGFGKEKLVVFLLVGVLLLVVAIPQKEQKEQATLSQQKAQDTAPEQESDYDKYKEKLEQELEQFLSQMEGVGRTKVLVIMERGEEEVLEERTVVAKKPPKVQGVFVLCQGAELGQNRSKLTRILSSILNLESYQVQLGKIRE